MCTEEQNNDAPLWDVVKAHFVQCVGGEFGRILLTWMSLPQQTLAPADNLGICEWCISTIQQPQGGVHVYTTHV